MSALPRLVGLPAVALALVSGVIGVQLAYGGGSFEPLGRLTRAPNALSPRSRRHRRPHRASRARSDRRAACSLNVSREALTLELAQSSAPTDAQVDALREGLLLAVDRMEEDGTLPPASELVDEALDSTDLNGFLEAAIRAMPDSVIDAALKTDDILTRAIEDLDLRAVLANIDNQDELNQQIEDAVTEAVKDSLVARLSDLL